MEKTVNRMKALGDLNRFRIVMMLLERPLCVCEMLEVLDIAGGTLSSHLKVLRSADIIDQRKDGRWIEYFVRDEKVRDLLAVIDDFIENRAVLENDRKKISVITRSVCSSGTKVIR